MNKILMISKIMFIAILLGGLTVHLPLAAAEIKNKPITIELKKLLKSDPKIRKMLELSIASAVTINKDKLTNPVKTLSDYYTYIDAASELIPQQILQDPKNLTRDQILQSICYFYFLVDQPIPELADKGLYKNSLQYYPPFSEWLRNFAKTWGIFLNTEQSWSEETYTQFLADPRFGLNNNWYESPQKWNTFNRFFSRYLRSPSVRPIASPTNSSIVTSPADSVPQGTWNINVDSKIQIKKGLKVKLATYYSVKDLLAEDSKYKDVFANGVLTHTFLNVNDYHRFHFPVSGIVREMKIIPQDVSLEVQWDEKMKRYIPIDSTGWQFSQTRGYVIIETKKYGMIALIPMGMAQVSSVNFEKKVTVGSSHKKGDMLGYFLFGGSDFIIIFQKVATFEIMAPKESPEKFKHIFMGEKYGKMNGDKEFMAEYQKIVNLDVFARSFDLPPLSQIDKTVTTAQVDLMIYKKIKATEMAPFDTEKIRKEAEVKYKLWKIGDEVKAVDAQGYKHDGELKEKNGSYVNIASVKIYAVDFSPSMLIHLFEKHRLSAIDNYIKSRKKLYYLKRRTYRKEVSERVALEYYKKYTFAHCRDKWWDYATYRAFLERGKVKYDKKRALKKAKNEARKKLEQESETNLLGF